MKLFFRKLLDCALGQAFPIAEQRERIPEIGDRNFHFEFAF